MKYLVLLLGLASLPAFAQEKENIPSFNSDRPGQSFSSQVLPAGALTLQSGIIYGFPKSMRSSGFSTRSSTVSFLGTEHLFRYGIFKRLEVDLGAAYVSTKISRNGVGGDNALYNKVLLAPISMLRLQVLEEGKAVPALNLQYQFDLSNVLRSSTVVGMQGRGTAVDNHLARVSISKSFDKLGLASNINIPLTDGPVGYTLNMSVSGANGGFFIEMFGNFEEVSGSGIKDLEGINYNAGVWIELSRVARLDFGLGKLWGETGNIFGSVGMTFNLIK
ncbi:MAG: hypothetical protein ACPF8V_02265 [Luteibaculum sp.]